MPASKTVKKVTALPRPFILSFLYAHGGSYPLSAEEAQRLLDEYPVVSASANRVVLQGDGHRSALTPATLGGGPAFEIERRQA